MDGDIDAPKEKEMELGKRKKYQLETEGNMFKVAKNKSDAKK